MPASSKPVSELQLSPGSICIASVRAVRSRGAERRRRPRAGSTRNWFTCLALGMQERHHAAERHAVARLELVDRADPVVEIRVAGDEREIGWIVGRVAVRVRLRERVALEHEGRATEVVEDPLQRSAADLAVVDVDEDVVAVGDDEHRVIGTVLVRRDPHPGRQLHDLRVRQLHHFVEPEIADLLGEGVDAELRDEHVGATVDAPHRREVEVIEVVVRQVHVVGREHLRRRLGDRRVVPPRSPVARPEQPRDRRGSWARWSRSADSCGR